MLFQNKKRGLCEGISGCIFMNKNKIEQTKEETYYNPQMLILQKNKDRLDRFA